MISHISSCMSLRLCVCVCVCVVCLCDAHMVYVCVYTIALQVLWDAIIYSAW